MIDWLPSPTASYGLENLVFVPSRFRHPLWSVHSERRLKRWDVRAPRPAKYNAAGKNRVNEAVERWLNVDRGSNAERDEELRYGRALRKVHRSCLCTRQCLVLRLRFSNGMPELDNSRLRSCDPSASCTLGCSFIRFESGCD
jgi:hypothetical protein